MNKKTNAIKFETKVFYKNKVYLPLEDVRKALGFESQKDFLQLHKDMATKIKGAGKCISETDYNQLLSQNKVMLSKQGHIEITKVDTLRSRIDTAISMYPIMYLLTRDYFHIMANKHGCKSAEEYVYKYDLPKEKNKCLDGILQLGEMNKSYKEDAKLLISATNRLRECGLDVQYLTTIDCNGRMSLQSYVVGIGVFYEVSIYDYEKWDEIGLNENREIILPYYNYDSPDSETTTINLSNPEVNRDFRKYGIVENMIWCLKNLKVTSLEDYEYSVFAYKSETINFDTRIDMLAKMIRPDSVDTIFVDGIVDCDEENYTTTLTTSKVFAE